MKNIFTEHPQSMGETYFQHMKLASIFGFKLLIAASVCIIHAIFPFLFKQTGSNILFKIIYQFIERSPKKEERMELIYNLITKKTAQKESYSQ